MSRFGLVGPSYTSQALNADAQQTMNLYPEVDESGAGNAPIILLPTPGLKVFANLTPSTLVTKTHTGTWFQGQTGKTFTVTITNNGPVPTEGTITFTETVPSGLTFVSLSGTGWTIVGNVATRSDSLAVGASYPAITVTVNVSPTATSPQVNHVSVSGGGMPAPVTATDSVVIQAGTPLHAYMTVSPSVTVPWNCTAMAFDSTGGTPTVIQSPLNPNTVFNQTSNTNTMHSDPSFGITNSGDGLVVQAAFLTGSAITPGISDTKGNAWTKVQDVFANGIQNVMWEATANASGTDTITVTSSANCLIAGAGIWEFSHSAGTTSASASGSGTSAQPDAGNLVTITAHTFALVLATCAPNAINTLVAGTGWSQPANQLNLQNGVNNLFVGWEWQVT